MAQQHIDRPSTHSPVVFPAPRKPERTVTGSGGGGVHDALLASLLVLVLVVLLVVDNFSNAPLTMSIGPSCWPCMIGTVLARGLTLLEATVEVVHK